MLGKDFFVFWQFGVAVLQGQPFYSSPEALYPPAMLFFFAPLGLLPFNLAFSLWTGLNTVLFYLSARKVSKTKAWIWFLFTPTIFILMTGQIDIIFFWMATFLDNKKPWKRILFAALITLKPQLAFVLLPWWLLKWIREKPKLFLQWLLACGILHSLPLLLDWQIYQKWIHSISSHQASRMPLSPGLFSFSLLNIPIWLIALLSLPIIYFGLKGNFNRSKAAQLLALPMGIWYDSIVLANSISWKILIPISWMAFIGSYLFKSSIPFTLIPLSVFLFAKNDGESLKPHPI